MQLSLFFKSHCHPNRHRHHQPNQRRHHQSSDCHRTDDNASPQHCERLQHRRYYASNFIMPAVLMTALLFLAQCSSISSLIVPNEVPSILSLVYSNIPPIKKGTDSRLGFGFRLGQHADFQVMVELGPQKETRPIGDPDNGSSFNKRQVNKAQQRAVQREVAKTESPPTSWLEKWSSQINNGAAPKSKKVVTTKSKPTKKAVVMKQVTPPPIASVPPSMPQQMPVQALQQLQMLYKMATSTTEENISQLTNEETITPSAPIGALPSTNLQEKLQLIKAPANVEELQGLAQKTPEQRKTEITKELMDVNLDE
ncbi:snustorr snarlik [Haematobia irritans]|uniref:snustorr snarlik n=1 Tax=Haematobia irritans TaxID=7368 RepID=UPI003F4FDAA4